MSKFYRIKPGDSLERISRVAYGTDAEAELIRGANPELSAGDLVAGTSIVLPFADDLENFRQRSTSFDDPDDNRVELSVERQRFRFWNRIVLTRSVDAFTRFQLGAVFEPDNAEFRRVFQPLAYQNAELSIGGIRRLRGTLVDVRPRYAKTRTVSAEGYGLPGVLGDVTMPAVKTGGLEWYELDLRQIATEVCKPFGLRVKFDADPGPAFSPEPVGMKSGQKPLTFLKRLAQQKQIFG